MADADAEIALLHQMQAGQESNAWDDAAGGSSGGIVPSHTENSDLQEEENFPDAQAHRASSPPSVVNPDDDTYYPMSPQPVPAVVLNTSAEDSRASSRASASQPRTIGGFLADDSDDDDDSAQPDGLTKPLPRSPLHNSSTAQHQVSQSDRAVGTTPLPAATVPSVFESVDTPASQTSAPHSAPQLSSVAAPMSKARLPHDIVGLLEDRIQGDPRGDLEAWLSLINEHRKRNKLDDTRAVYERFLKVFPHAVSYLYYCSEQACPDIPLSRFCVLHKLH
jgi:cleavage stimulation factor subunit 3